MIGLLLLIHSFQTNLRTSEKAVTMRRPKSALEFDKLLRIKSDIQLNITKKVLGIVFFFLLLENEIQK